MLSRRYISFVSGACLLLSACAGSGAGPLGLGAIIGDRNLAGAEPLFSEREDKCLDSADQLLGVLYGPPSEAKPIGNPRRPVDCGQIATSLQYVLGFPDPAIKNPSGLTSSRYDQAKRNEIIDAMMAASNRKCTRYTALLKNADGAVNASLSVGAIISGGLGAFVGGAATAKALAGTASILSGSRSAINETYLSNLTIQVLAAAMEKARTKIRQDITNRQACSVSQYTLSRGIEDVFSYHNSCSLSAGLAEAALSIERSQNPGLEAMHNTFAQYASLVKQVSDASKPGTSTPISVTPLIPDLKTVNDANSALAVAQADVATLSTALADLQKTADTAKAASTATPDNKDLETVADDAAKAAADKRVELNKATEKRDDFVSAFKQELQRLASSVTLSSPLPVTPESRQCPYGVGA